MLNLEMEVKGNVCSTNTSGDLMIKDLGKAKALYAFFASVITSMTDFQESQATETSEKDWSKDSLPSVKKDQVRACLNKLKLVYGSWWDPHLSAEGVEQCCESTLNNLRKVTETSRSSWGLIESNVVPIFKKVKEEDLGNYRLVSHTSIPGMLMEQTILETISKHIKEKNLTGSSHYGFMKGKLYFTSFLWWDV